MNVKKIIIEHFQKCRKSKALVFTLLEILVGSNILMSQEYLYKRFSYADEEFYVSITKDSFETWEEPITKDSVSLEYQKQKYIYDIKSPFTKICTKESSYGIFFCSIDDINYLTLLHISSQDYDKAFYKEFLTPLTYVDNDTEYLYLPVLQKVSVVKSESYITEKNKTDEIKYLPDNWDLHGIPWAVSKDSETKNVYFKLNGSFKKDKYEPVNQLVIVNGFISSSKDYLYYQNSRARTIKLSYNGISFTRELKDVADYQVIELEKPIQINSNSEIKLSILDYYPGMRYSDIVISAVLFPQVVKKRK